MIMSARVGAGVGLGPEWGTDTGAVAGVTVAVVLGIAVQPYSDVQARTAVQRTVVDLGLAITIDLFFLMLDLAN